MKLKLNYGRTILIGFAFMSICIFWQFYDNEIPRILKYTFGLGEGITGFIMALDNVFALFLLPLFGTLSDKTNTKIGKSTVPGTITRYEGLGDKSDSLSDLKYPEAR